MIDELNQSLELIEEELNDLVSKMEDKIKFKKIKNLDMVLVFSIFERKPLKDDKNEFEKEEKTRFRLDYVNSVSYEIPEGFQKLDIGKYFVTKNKIWIFKRDKKRIRDYFNPKFKEYVVLSPNQFGMIILQHFEFLVNEETHRRSIFINSKKPYERSDEEEITTETKSEKKGES